MKTAQRAQPANSLETFIQSGLLVLAALMPFHAFLSVWLGTILGHRAIIQSWKEVLLVILSLATITLIVRQPQHLHHLRQNQPTIILIATLTLLALLTTAVTRPPLATAAFGLKTDFEFLGAFLLALVVATPVFIRRLIITTLAAATIVIGFGVLEATVLPPDFLTHFGYGPATIPPYQTITLGTDSLRFPSTLGGPNQLGTYLIIPISLILTLAKRRRWLLALLPFALIVLFHTQSRSAWLGALVATIIVGLSYLPTRKIRLIATALITTAGLATFALLPWLTQGDSPLQYYLLHSQTTLHDQRGSDVEHLASLQQGLNALTAQPLGHGLGTAGPAALHTGSNIVIEDYYLQLGYEIGLLGMLAFIALVGLLLWYLWRSSPPTPVTIALAAALIGISVNALVLPAWTDSTSALIFWILLGAIIGTKRKAQHA